MEYPPIKKFRFERYIKTDNCTKKNTTNKMKTKSFKYSNLISFHLLLVLFLVLFILYYKNITEFAPDTLGPYQM